MTRGHPNCFTYRYDFFKKVIDAIFEIDNAQVLQNALAYNVSRLGEKEYKKFVKEFVGEPKAAEKKPSVDHREQLKKLGKL